MDLKILIIDDDPIFLFLQKRILELNDFSANLSVFDSGQGGLDYLKSHQDDNVTFLIFLDINMPNINGWQFIEMSKTLKINNLYIVIVTSSIDEVDKKTAFSFSETIEYFEKPIKSESLIKLKKHPKIEMFFKNS